MAVEEVRELWKKRKSDRDTRARDDIDYLYVCVCARVVMKE